MTGQLNPNKSGQQQDTQILNTQLQSVQMQLQEKHNELNYYKSYCEELEKEVARLKLQLALKDQEVEDLTARQDAPVLRSRLSSSASVSTRSATVSGDDASAAAAHIRGTGRPSKVAPWIVGIGSSRLHARHKEPSSPPLSTVQQHHTSPGQSEAASATPNNLPRTSGSLMSESVSERHHRLSTEINAPKEERRRLSILATLAAAGEAAKDYDTYHCDRESVHTLNALEAEVHALEAEVKLLERVASGEALNLDLDDLVLSSSSASSSASSSPGGSPQLQQRQTLRMIASSAPIPTRTRPRVSLSEARATAPRIDCPDEADADTQVDTKGDGVESKNDTGGEESQLNNNNNNTSGGSSDNSAGNERRRDLSKRSLSADYTNDAANAPQSQSDGDEVSREASESSGDERPGQKRLSWVKEGAPWEQDNTAGGAAGETTKTTGKRKSLSSLRLVKEENRKGFSFKAVLPLVAQCEGFTVECEYDYTIKTEANYYSFLQQNWYKEHYYPHEHTCFIGVDTPLGTVIAAVKREKDDSGNYQYSIVVLTQDGDQKAVVPASALGAAAATPGWAHKVVEASFPLLLTTGCLKHIDHPQLPQAIVNLEEKERPRKYKFGVVLVQKGQDSEEHFFSNQRGSADYETFLQLLGNRVRLQGWEKFAGGLNVKNDITGTDSIYTEWRENQIMYHVSTLLPYTPDDTQQIERKRHIGNDIVLIVFLDDPTASYCPSLIKSHFIHVVVLVRVEKRDENGNASHLRVAVTAKDGVPLFGPTLPKPAVFSVDDPRSFRDFFLSKLINAELAAYRTASFSRKLRVARRAMLDDISLKYWT